jgi:prepilin-type N-terminal cleavage/methylation domain-containing protein
MRHRRGVSLIELMIAITVMTILGAALVSLMLGYNRFQERTEGKRAARRVANSAVNVMVNELRMVDPSWGIEAATATAVQVKSPYAIGVVCASTTSTQTVALLPVDSLAFTAPGYSGFAWRADDGTYTVIPGGTLAEVGSFPMACTSLGVQPITAPASAPNQRTRVVTLNVGPGGLAAPIALGTPVMLYRRVRFFFGPSVEPGLSGRTALWRQSLDGGAQATEQAAPFDAAAAFRFIVSGAITPQATPPAGLWTLRGLQLYLPGESEHSSRTRGSPEQAELTTSVYFVNTMTP